MNDDRMTLTMIVIICATVIACVAFLSKCSQVTLRVDCDVKEPQCQQYLDKWK